MKKFAIDIALFFPEKINKVCIDINRKKDSGAYSDLSKSNNHPHITLAMGVLNEDELNDMIKKLKEVSQQFHPIQLELSGISFIMTPENKKSYQFNVEPSVELKKLHALIMRKISPDFSYKVNENMFFLDWGEKFNKSSMFWVENYGKIHSNPDKYKPHISLKCKKAEYSKFPLKFTTSKIAVCQLGNYCTCRQIFKVVELK